MPVPISGFAHVRLTVSDIERSRAFYDAVFGLPVVFEVPPDADPATLERLSFLFGGVIYAVPGGLLGLRPVAPAQDRFHEDRAGLDHLSFAVADVGVLADAAALLDRLAIPHEAVKDIGAGHLLEFRDPDGIALEFFAPAG